MEVICHESRFAPVKDPVYIRAGYKTQIQNQTEIPNQVRDDQVLLLGYFCHPELGSGSESKISSSEAFTQVIPVWVELIDQTYFPIPMPIF
jgi:translation initiation factor 2 beta subunit (eIF-2beta)/eIF-5